MPPRSSRRATVCRRRSSRRPDGRQVRRPHRQGAGEEQTEQVFKNLAAILDASGSGLDKIVKTTVFLVDFADFAAMNEVYRKHVGEVPPARSTVSVKEFPRGARIEIEAIAGA